MPLSSQNFYGAFDLPKNPIEYLRPKCASVHTELKYF